jgi:nicotinate-nucleotide adenylyltransferase
MAFRQQSGANTRLYFITGADAMLELMTWRDPAQLAAMCEFIAVVRPGYDLRPLEETLGASLMARCRVLQVPGIDISSTELRRRAAEGRTLRYFTPPAVERYIRTHRLYAQLDEEEVAEKSARDARVQPEGLRRGRR